MYLRSLKKQRNEVYMEDGIGTDREGNNLTLADILPADESDIADIVAESLEAKKLYKIMREVLSPAEYTIMVKRYGLGGTKRLTQKEIADELGISRSYVSRIEKRCLEKLSEEFL